MEEDPELWRFVLRDSVTPATGPSAIPVVREDIARRVAAALHHRLHERGLTPQVADAWAHAPVGLVHGASAWWTQHRTLSRAALTEQLTALVCGGLSVVLTRAGVRGGNHRSGPGGGVAR